MSGDGPAATPLQVRQTGTPDDPLDLAAWGEDHAGQPIPDYVVGDECLFCHRDDVGPTWQTNTHAVTVRLRDAARKLQSILEEQPALAAIAPEVQYFLGGRNRLRFLKQEGYGRFALLSSQAVMNAAGEVDDWIDPDNPTWDADTFADRCAGCHTTAVDAATETFSAFGLDCYACHGDVTLDHASDPSLAWWSQERRDSREFLEVQAMASICAQCHLRDATSRSTGLPYPNTFIAGDNLFRDFDVDFTRVDDQSLNPGDRHVLRSVQEVVLYGAEQANCLSCHRVHAQSTQEHEAAQPTLVCLDCHEAEGGDGRGLMTSAYRVRSTLCEYEGALGYEPDQD